MKWYEACSSDFLLWLSEFLIWRLKKGNIASGSEEYVSGYCVMYILYPTCYGLTFGINCFVYSCKCHFQACDFFFLATLLINFQGSYKDQTHSPLIGKSTNITWHKCSVEKRDRQELLQQKGCVIWITGLSGSGFVHHLNSLFICFFFVICLHVVANGKSRRWT